MAVFQGVPGDVAGIRFSRLVERSPVTRAQVPAGYAARLEDGVQADDLADARSIALCAPLVFSPDGCTGAAPAASTTPTDDGRRHHHHPGPGRLIGGVPPQRRAVAAAPGPDPVGRGVRDRRAGRRQRGAVGQRRLRRHPGRPVPRRPHGAALEGAPGRPDPAPGGGPAQRPRPGHGPPARLRRGGQGELPARGAGPGPVDGARGGRVRGRDPGHPRPPGAGPLPLQLAAAGRGPADAAGAAGAGPGDQRRPAVGAHRPLLRPAGRGGQDRPGGVPGRLPGRAQGAAGHRHLPGRAIPAARDQVLHAPAAGLGGQPVRALLREGPRLQPAVLRGVRDPAVRGHRALLLRRRRARPVRHRAR